MVDKKFENPHLIKRGDSVRINPGKSHITVVWRTINDHSFTINAKPGETVGRQIVHTFPPYPKTSYKAIIGEPNLTIITDPNSSIYFDGEYVGEHIAKVVALTGKHKLVIKHPEFGSLTKRIDTKIYEQTHIERYNKSPSDLSFATQLLPGAAYVSKKQNYRAGVTYGLLAGLSIQLFRQQKAYTNKKNEFSNWKQLYNRSQTTEELIEYREKAEKAQRNLDKISEKFNAYLLGLGAVYIISTLDGIRKPRQGYKHNSNNFYANASVSAVSIMDGIVPQLTLKFSLK
ncbi:PEGA domain-containing protein [Gracilimonas sediminicola]|uniref:PEGA domain-containing protein n=1 Tax=Gracilimonas sediminicola TaxID=2952158 RepID=A0A9X2L1A0_9BACT|nr:PEGA domain-containing protein [Gracilimonas sediminicola]